MKNLNLLAEEAKSNAEKRNQLLLKYKSFLLKTASKYAKRYITEHDDEWSVALFAMNEAIESYSSEKGNFLPFSELIIKRRLYDHYKKSNHHQEILVEPYAFSGESPDEESPSEIHLSLKKSLSVSINTDIKEEIDSISQVLKQYDISFFDLVKCSPKAEKTKNACKIAVISIYESPEIYSELKQKKYLPIKNLEKITKLPRKILENHRNYIIAAVEILKGDYPELSEYLQFIRKEL